jgi:hypothetical protein
MVQLVVVWGLLYEYYIACLYYIVIKMPETNKLCVMLVYFNYHYYVMYSYMAIVV